MLYKLHTTIATIHIFGNKKCANIPKNMILLLYHSYVVLKRDAVEYTKSKMESKKVAE